MRFRNPRADALLHLTVQGQTHVFDAPQTVAVRMGNLTVDSFVASGAITTRTVALGRELMGGSDSFIVEILVDKTFVPASVPGSASLDTRELGIRVVSAAIEPSVLVRPSEGIDGDARTTAANGTRGRSGRINRRLPPPRRHRPSERIRPMPASSRSSCAVPLGGGRRYVSPSTGGRSMSSFWKRTVGCAASMKHRCRRMARREPSCSSSPAGVPIMLRCRGG